MESRNGDKFKVTLFQSAIAGAGAGSFTRAVAQPLDVLKIRFQLQLEPIKIGSKYSSIPQAVHCISREEGILTLWSGHLPAQLLSITYGIVQFSMFEKLTSLWQEEDPRFFLANKYGINFLNGAIAAKCATVVSFPFDTIRTRLIAEQKTHKAYRGFTNAFITIVRTEGVKALFKGLMPTLAQIAPHSGIQFATYKFLSEFVAARFNIFHRKSNVTAVKSTLMANLLSGSAAGFVAKTAIYPFDLVKKRLQIQGFQKHRTAFGKQMYCTGVLNCLRLTIINEGIFALYKGYWPSCLKAILVTALHFAVYDEIKHYLMRVQKG